MSFAEFVSKNVRSGIVTENNLQDVKEIFETTSYKTANRYLAAGWVLIETYKTCYDYQAFPNEQDIHYVLAWNLPTRPADPHAKD
jgi:hypothetical protein